MKKAKHSPLPWREAKPIDESDDLYIDLLDARRNCLASFHNDFHGRRAIKEAIRAVNSHDRAVELAENVTRLNYELATSAHQQCGTLTVSHRWANNIAILARKFQELNNE